MAAITVHAARAAIAEVSPLVARAGELRDLVLDPQPPRCSHTPLVDRAAAARLANAGEQITPARTEAQ